MQIDGHGHRAPGRWTITRNGEEFWPSVDEFETETLDDGTRGAMTFRKTVRNAG